jgi:hypothetical protein
MKTRYIVLLAAAALGGGYALGHAAMGAADEAIITPGTVSGIAAEHVSLLTFTSAAATLTAQRSRTGGDFVVQVTFADGRPAQHCIAPPDLSGQLAHFSSFGAKRQLSFEERGKEFPVHLGNLFVQDSGREPGNVLMVFTNEQGSSIAAVFDRYAAELVVPLAAFRWMDKGCAVFAQAENTASIPGT